MRVGAIPAASEAVMTTLTQPASTGHPDGPGAVRRSSLWDPTSGRFDPVRLRLALVVRDWTADAFAHDTGCGRTSIYKALQGSGVRDRTAISILRGLAQREPRLPLTG